MSNVPTKGLKDKRFNSLSLPTKTSRNLVTTGRRNPNMGSSIRGRRHGGGFPPSQV